MNIFATLSYGCAAVAFLVLTMLLVTSWRGRRQGAFVIAASAATAAWAGVLAASSYVGSVSGPIVYYAEIGRSLAWILALSSIAGPAAPRWLRKTVLVVGIALLFGPFVAPYLIATGLLPDDSTLLLARAGLLLALLGLVLLEQIYRNSGPADRHRIEVLWFSALASCSPTTCFCIRRRSSCAASRSMRGASGACSTRSPCRCSRSRRAAIRTGRWTCSCRGRWFSTASTFIAVGAYLTVMGLGGFYVRQVGGEWGRVGQIVFMAGSLVILSGLMASRDVASTDARVHQQALLSQQVRLPRGVAALHRHAVERTRTT